MVHARCQSVLLVNMAILVGYANLVVRTAQHANHRLLIAQVAHGIILSGKTHVYLFYKETHLHLSLAVLASTLTVVPIHVKIVPRVVANALTPHTAVSACQGSILC